MLVLGIETSCDETSAAVLADGRRVLSNVVASQADLHARWGGVVPEMASRKHVERVLPVIWQAMDEAGCSLNGIGGIAVTNRPGLIGALLVGVSAAKALGYALRRPTVGVHHLEGHLAALRLACPDAPYPMACLLASGGHTELLYVTSDGAPRSLGRTRDDAAGECFDKCARLLDLPYPGGPHIERLAREGDPRAVAFPRARMENPAEFSFSGLKTAVARFVAADGGATAVADVAASLQEAIVDVLVSRTVTAALSWGCRAVAITGGVAANRALAARLHAAAEAAGLTCATPPVALCTDNAAMVAAAGWKRLSAGDDDMPYLDAFASEAFATAVA
ncbi:MAG TPA: tRNA (adenosine(37)-N6)-threonylcarbamoyltransferase complex transferase subunit TsaD [Chthonomonadales bacterium]|nr:tRNA (adenosine(37)-N6)-threonylcarbamoyltransferase complex transferase subunit TsaD [Chthonomonadales bacterium]